MQTYRHRRIVTWETKIPKKEVSLLYKRKPDCHDYFTCSSYLNQSKVPRIYMSPEELLQIFQHITDWISVKFKSFGVLNQQGEIISGGKETDNKRLTMTFSECCYKNTLDMRI